MIHVENLSKFYGAIPAIHEVSFSIQQGEITGFLGPNGAGKTTTMRILTGFMPATSGKASVAGFDVFDQSLDLCCRARSSAACSRSTHQIQTAIISSEVNKCLVTTASTLRMLPSRVTISDIQRRKPYPDCYLLAAEESGNFGALSGV